MGLSNALSANKQMASMMLHGVGNNALVRCTSASALVQHGPTHKQKPIHHLYATSLLQCIWRRGTHEHGCSKFTGHEQLCRDDVLKRQSFSFGLGRAWLSPRTGHSLLACLVQPTSRRCEVYALGFSNESGGCKKKEKIRMMSVATGS